MPARSLEQPAAFRIARAGAEALAWARTALARDGLCPLSGNVRVLAAHASDGMLLGAIGLERYGTDGLLRSLVVAPKVRAGGVGTALVAALEREARREGVVTLYLLTETAEPFFNARGYQRMERELVPAAVAASEQFRLYCPATAVCLCKKL